MPEKNMALDAWQDDWEAAADRTAVDSEDSPAPATRLTKAERLARHVEENRKLWESAESPETFHFVECQSSGGVPLVPPYQKPVKVLSRCPPPPQVDITSAVGDLALAAYGGGANNNDDDDETKEQMPTIEQVRERQATEREKKYRRYNEARTRIFGPQTVGGSQGGDKGSSSSNAQSSANSQGPSRGGDAQSHKSLRGKGRLRARQGQERGGGRQAASPSPARNAWNGGGGELYDPNHSPKPAVAVQEATCQDDGGVPVSKQEQAPRQPFREPRVPGSGAGFAARFRE